MYPAIRHKLGPTGGRITAAVASLFLMQAVPAWSLTVTAETDRVEALVGESVVVTVSASRSEAEGDPAFVGAGIQAPPPWRRGGQSAQSARREGDQILKSWRFELIGVAPGTTTVTPVVYLSSELSLGMQADSVLGAPITLVVLPIPEPAVWPWFLGGAIIVVGATYLVSRVLRKRRTAYERPSVPPLDEAVEILAAIRVNRREDRAQQYFSDIERVIHGYLSRRLGADLSGRTAAEIAAAVTEHVPRSETVEELRELLRRCAASKFGGQRIDFNALAGLEEEARRLLELMEQNWV